MKAFFTSIPGILLLILIAIGIIGYFAGWFTKRMVAGGTIYNPNPPIITNRFGQKTCPNGEEMFLGQCVDMNKASKLKANLPSNPPVSLPPACKEWVECAPVNPTMEKYCSDLWRKCVNQMGGNPNKIGVINENTIVPSNPGSTPIPKPGQTGYGNIPFMTR